MARYELLVVSLRFPTKVQHKIEAINGQANVIIVPSYSSPVLYMKGKDYPLPYILNQPRGLSISGSTYFLNSALFK